MIFRLLLPILFCFACDNGKQHGNLESKSLLELSAILQKEPANAEAFYYRSLLYSQEGKVDSALSDIKRAVEIDSMQARYFLHLADLYLFSNQSRFTRLALERAALLDTSSAIPPLKLAELFLYVEMYQDALFAVNRSLRKDDRNSKAYYLKGMIFKAIGDTAKAISSFITTTELDIDYVLAYEQLGLIYAAKNDRRALDYYNAGLERNALSPTLLYNKGYWFQQKNLWDSAKATYDKLIAIQPNFDRAHYALGFMAYEKGNFETALQHFTRAAESNPRSDKAHFMRGLCLEYLGKIREASQAYEATLVANPNHPDAGKQKAGLKF